MRTRTFLALTCSLVAVALFAADSARFSQSITPEQRTTAGLDRLSSDQVAALDALVRLNLTQTAADAQKAERASVAPPATVAPAATAPVPFSQALSAAQRRAAGLEELTAEQCAAIDTLVAAQTAAAPRYEPNAPRSVEAVEFFPNRYEVHGEFGFSLGAGSGGYSSRAGWVSTSVLDTKTGTEIGVSVAAGREKWNRPFRYTNDWRDVGLSLGVPLYRAP